MHSDFIYNVNQLFITETNSIKLFFCFLISIAFVGCNDDIENTNISLQRLTCDYQTSPLGIDNSSPRFGWKIVSDSLTDIDQTAYQILVATSVELLNKNIADVWDSELISSEQSFQIPFEGKSLQSSQRYYWKVRVKIKDVISAYSAIDYFETALFRESDWQAKWIAAPSVWDFKSFVTQRNVNQENTGHWDENAPMLRHDFTSNKEIDKARMYICGVGYYEAYLNGKRISDDHLNPAFTKYDKRLLYQTYDVTSLIKKENAIGIMLGNGWYNMNSKAVWGFDKAPWRGKPRVIMQLEITYKDGSKEIVETNDKWKAAPAPVTYNNIRVGMTYDARLEQEGWANFGFNDQKWSDVFTMPSPGGELRAQSIEPIKVFEKIKPKSIQKLGTNNYLVDFGQNMAGWITLKVNGTHSDTIKVRYGEILDFNGHLDQTGIIRHMREDEIQTDRFILADNKNQVFETKFTFHGFQYVEITGYKNELRSDDIMALAATSNFDVRGTFECSDPVINKIQEMTLRSYKSNFFGYPMDCPQREKNGWTGDAQLVTETGLFNFHAGRGYEKYLNDMADEQKSDGNLSAIVPTSQWGYFWGNGPAWIGAYPIIAWQLYQFDGNTRVLKEHYDGMKKMTDFFTRKTQDHILSIGLGDWAYINTKTPVPLTSTAYYYHFADIISKSAALLGKESDKQKYRKLADSIKVAFNTQFYNQKTGYYANGSQTAQSIALYFDLVPTKEKEKVVKQMLHAVTQADNHLDAGILGAKYLLHALATNGHADVAYSIITTKSYPGWGYLAANGATTLWEHWKGAEAKGLSSLNHIMFGDVSNWFYQYIAGIRPDANAPGFKHFFIEPKLTTSLEWAAANFESAYGNIKVAWKKQGDLLELNIEIPHNSSATLILPKGKLTGADIALTSKKEHISGKMTFELKSGTYNLNIK